MIGLDAWWDEPAYQASRGTFSERGAFILGKLEAHDAAKLQDVLADVYRDDVPDPRGHDPVRVGDHPAVHGREPHRDQGRAAPDGAGVAVVAACAARTHHGRNYMKVDDDRDYRLPLMPLPDDTLSNMIAFSLFWVITLGLVYPAWLIGSPWGWFVYAGTFILLCGFLELRSLTNILVRTLPALRLLWLETERLRQAEEQRLNSGGTGRPER